MTDETTRVIIVAMVTALPPTLTALAALVQGRRNGNKISEVGVKADGAAVKAETAAGHAADAAGQAVATASKVEETHATAERIEQQTNGHLAKLSADLATMTAAHQESVAMVGQLLALMNPEQRVAAQAVTAQGSDALKRRMTDHQDGDKL